MFNPVIVIPVFRHGRELARTLDKLSAVAIPSIVVDDGNDLEQKKLIRRACAAKEAGIIEREQNGGKGAAVIDALREAQSLGYTHAFQIDADGQHNFDRLPLFLDAARNQPSALVLGYPRYNQSVPLSRLYGRYLTTYLVYLNTMSFAIRDSMCGFKILPIERILKIIDKTQVGKYMDFDTEICVRSRWARVPIVNLPVEVDYPQGVPSNFRLIQDNLLLSILHIRLFFGMLSRLPVWWLRRLSALLGGKFGLG